MKCECGGTFSRSDGLEGAFCDKCGKFVENFIPDEGVDVDRLYSLERIGSIRGVPVNEIKIGSETKGRLEICIPAYATKEEAKAIVDIYLDVLQYTKEQIDGRGLDIYSSRGKKNE